MILHHLEQEIATNKNHDTLNLGEYYPYKVFKTVNKMKDSSQTRPKTVQKSRSINGIGCLRRTVLNIILDVAILNRRPKYHQIRQGIDRTAVDPDFKMQMGPLRAPRVADLPNRLPGFDLLSDR